MYWKLVKAGYIDWDGKKRAFVATDEGVPQGGIVSPLLSNLVLHELDEFVQKLILEKEEANPKTKPYITNPKYHAMTMKIYRLKKKGRTLTTSDRKKLVENVSQRRKLKSIIPNPKITRLKYVRYADD